MINKKTLLLLFASAITLAFAIDNDPLTSLLLKFDRMRTEYPQEKVHLHFDKPYYSLGDDIWFKAYVVNAEQNELSVLSKVLYVDVFDDRDSLTQTLTLPLANGLTHGDIKITDSLFDAGNYHIKAYTKWMLNFDKEFVFEKDITIGDALTPAAVLADAQFTVSDKNLNTTLTLSRLSGQLPLTGKPLNYKLLYKGKAIASGKLQTDSSGTAKFNTIIDKGYNMRDMQLQTAIAVSPQVSVNRIFNVVANTAKIDLQFFPEGGHLVNGVRSKVGFKAVKPDGNGAHVSGYIVDQNNNRICDFSSAHAGMGAFAIVPSVGNTYSAILNGSPQKYDLPLAKNEGYVLSVNQSSNDSLNIRVSASSAMINGNEVAIVAQQNGVVKYVTKVKLNEGALTTAISNNRFKTGIAHITLFADDYMPIAERLIFIDKQDQLGLTLTTSKPAYTQREKVQTFFKATDKIGMPVQGNFSVTVTDESKVANAEDDEKTILSDLLLTSDLKGYVETPNYYFNHPNDDKKKQLDNLMLTQGWSRFNWADIKADKLPLAAFKPQAGLEVEGSITSLRNKTMPNAKVTLLAQTSGGPLLADTVADESGNFRFTNLDFVGSTSVIVRAKNAKDGNNVKILLVKPPKPSFDTSTALRDESYSVSMVNYLRSTQKRFDELSRYGLLDKGIMLKEVRIERKKPSWDQHIDGSALLGGSADIVLTKEKLKYQSNLINAFYGLAGLEVRGKDERNRMVYRIGRVTSITRREGMPMMVLVNGMEQAPNILCEISPADVEGIEVLKAGHNTAVYGDSGYWGVILVTLKKGGSDYINVAHTYLNRMLINGYAAQREFYSPAYDQPIQNKVADLRSTIYWNPDVVTDGEGKASISYFTADEPGTYRVTAEGIDIDGRLARQTFTYTVK